MIAITIISSISVRPWTLFLVGILAIVLSSSLWVCDLYPVKGSDPFSLCTGLRLESLFILVPSSVKVCEKFSEQATDYSEGAPLAL